ncbi:unnamed protein product, partial [Polarella glacialis]
DPGIGCWTTPENALRIRSIEEEGHNLLSRAKRRAKEKLVSTIALAGFGADLTGEMRKTDGPANAFKMADSVNNAAKEVQRSARPWDMEAPALGPLMDVLEEAAICSADVKLRRQAEVLLLASARRALEAALNCVEDQSLALEDAIGTARAALRLVELEDPGDLPRLKELAEEEVHCAILRELPDALPEFHDAVAKGDIDLVTWLLDREQANPSATNVRTGIPPIVLAAKAGDVAMCKLLLGRGADVDGRVSFLLRGHYFQDVAKVTPVDIWKL